MLRLCRGRESRDGEGDDLHDVAGPPRPPHAVRDRGRDPGAQDPDHLPGPRRRLRQQGSDLPRVRRRHGRVAPHRAAGEVGRRPHGKPDLDRLRPGLPHARRAGAQGRQDDRPAREDALRQRSVLLRCPADGVQGRALPHRHGLLRHPGGARGDGRRVHEQGAGRRGLPLLVPRHRGLVPDRAARADGRLRDRGRPDRVPPDELHPAGAVPVHLGDRVRVRLGQLRGRTRPRAREARLRGPAEGAGGGPQGGPAHRHRRRHVHRGRGRRQGQGLQDRRPADERRRRAARFIPRARQCSS